MAPPPEPNRNRNEYPDPAAFIRQMMGGGFDPDHPGATGRGVDHTGADNTLYPTFWPGFPFDRPPHPPGPPGPPGSDHPRPPSPPSPPGPGPVPPPPPPPDHGRHGRHHPHYPHHSHHLPGAWSWGGPGGSGGGGWGGWNAEDSDFHFSDGHGRDRGHGRHGRHGRGRRHHHDSDEEGTREKPIGVSEDDKNNDKSSDEKKTTGFGDEKTGSPDTVRGEVPDPDEIVPEYEEANSNSNNNRNETFTGGFGGFGHGWGGRRGRGGFGGRGDCHRGSGGRRRHHADRHNDTPDADAAFNFPDMMRGIMSHPMLQQHVAAVQQHMAALQQMGAAARSGAAAADNTTENNDEVGSFAPPVDIFHTAGAYVLHVALPGVKRDDVGVHWDPEHSALTVAGVVHRPGNEAFLQTLHSSERRVGVFEKKVVLPPKDLAGASEQPREEIDAERIAAKLDDGVLVIIVPKMEKEWTEVRKVDIL